MFEDMYRPSKHHPFSPHQPQRTSFRSIETAFSSALLDPERFKPFLQFLPQARKPRLTEEVDDVIKKYQRNVVATAARVCEPSKRENCVNEAKDGTGRGFRTCRSPVANLKGVAGFGVQEEAKTLASCRLKGFLDEIYR